MDFDGPHSVERSAANNDKKQRRRSLHSYVWVQHDYRQDRSIALPNPSRSWLRCWFHDSVAAILSSRRLGGPSLICFGFDMSEHILTAVLVMASFAFATGCTAFLIWL